MAAVCAVLAAGCGSPGSPLLAGHLPALRDGPAGQRGTVASLAFSADGQLLAVADGRAGGVTVWRLDGPGGPRHASRISLEVASGPVRPRGERADTRPVVDSVRFAGDRRTLAVHVFQQFGVAQASVSLWDLTAPEHPVRLVDLPESTPAGSAGMRFSPTGSLLAVRGYDSAVTTLWDTTDAARPRRVGRIQSDMGSGALAMSPDATLLAIGGPGGTTLWDIHDPVDPRPRGPVLAPFRVCGPGDVGCWNRQGSDHLDSVVVSPDGHTLAVGGCDGYVETFDVTDPRTPRPTGHLAAHTTTRDEFCVEGLAFSPDGDVLAVADIEGTTTLWDMSDPDHATRLGAPLGGGHPGSGYAVAFSPDGDILATGGAADSAVLLWDVRDPAHPVALTDPPEPTPPPAAARPVRVAQGRHLGPAEPGSFGIDLSTPITTARLSRIDTHIDQLTPQGITAKPRFVGRYISVGARQKLDRDLSPAEVALILDEDRALVVFQRALGNGPRNWLEPDRATGRKIGQNAVANARTVGLPRGTQLFLDIENIDPNAGHAAIADYCLAWAAEVRAAGYLTGLYAGLGTGSHFGLTGDEYDGLAFDGYWKPGNIELPVPTTQGYAAIQHHPPAFDLPVSPTQDPSFLVDADHTQLDTRGRTVTVLSR